MSNTVHTPGTVQGEDIAKHRDKEIGNDQLFVPEIPRYQCGQDHLKQETEREVETVLKHYYWVNTIQHSTLTPETSLFSDVSGVNVLCCIVLLCLLSPVFIMYKFTNSHP